MASSQEDPPVLIPAELLGITLDHKRMRDVLAAYAPIWAEIRKLRELDFSELQPAVVFRLRETWDEVDAIDA